MLRPAFKLELVRALRCRIADESAWLPGKVKGATAYAAKINEGALVLLDAKSPEVTRFSLLGAFLLEMERRHVAPTAVGRKRFLDEEIPEAIRQVRLEHMIDEEREHAQERLAREDLQPLDHSQCLAALGVLEGRYTQRMEQRQIEQAKRRLGSVGLADLVKKLEQKAAISPEELATALYHELMEVSRRLENVERRLGRERPRRADQG